MIGIGLMSGTSLDGLDIALCKIEGFDLETSIELLAFDSIPMAQAMREKILKVSDPKTSRIDDITSLNMEIGQWYAEAITEFMKKNNLDYTLDFIASHGQTIYHIPNDTKNHKASSMQIGDPSFMALSHDCPVVFNFRMMDIAAQGEGAPLVPFTDYVQFHNKEKNIVLHNIGGIANLSFLDKTKGFDDVLAFDTGPGNMMINAATMYYYQEPYDDNGDYAKQGVLIDELFETLKNNPYYDLKPPKSTGREMFGETILEPLFKQYKTVPNDVIYTLTKFTAWTIQDSYRKFLPQDLDQIIISGGGAYNPVLMHELQVYLPQYTILSQEDLGFSSDAKEAIAFAILGNQTLNNRPSNVPSATGANQQVIQGQICPKPFKS
ncbi:anhydro-N-acetylmuramic acid kinase AnmK [Erysipelothrix urinaevulpis]|uniref:anhydro-N-acetylmuramic acid kinase AnmK n=1 Tax=Erysipelothrix urinaevulpis TaxID=2683717 RepID=UPI001356844C|nr:anhydro-N-acetylmuramic acid kinase AnmK [Erysipelothrix urinaevulpis]